MRDSGSAPPSTSWTPGEHHPRVRHAAPQQATCVKLAPREVAALEAVAELGDRRAAAARLGISVRTLDGYLSNARAKLDAVTTLQAYHRHSQRREVAANTG